MFVADRMTANPVVITPDTSVTTAKDLMQSHNFRRLPIVEKDKLVGWVTENDLRQVAPSSATTLSVYEVNYLLAKLKISDVMKKDVISVQMDEPIEEAALLMLHHKIGGLPVLNAEGKLVGVITETDIFKAFLAMSGVERGDATRFTLKVTDRAGILESLGGLFAKKDLSISSVAVYKNEENEEVRLVLRVPVNEAEAKKVLPDIEAMGIEVVALHYLTGGK